MKGSQKYAARSQMSEEQNFSRVSAAAEDETVSEKIAADGIFYQDDILI